jgi:site-specific DNA-cytosine methylase
MLAYANEARPTTIILENVLNAPWEHKKGKRQEKGDSKEISITSHLESIGYSCVFLKADTKDFYLPHTRQRGYMVCIDNTLPNISEKVDALLYQCKNIFNKLKCPASVPVEAMLLRADDPRLRSGANESNGVSRQKIEWAKCRAGHEDYRRQLGLGNKREMTHWRPDGAVRNPDYFIPFSGQKERVSDIIEIAHLRNLVRGFDDRYYRYFLISH